MRRAFIGVLAATLVLALCARVIADEHSSHHPGAATTGAPDAPMAAPAAPPEVPPNAPMAAPAASPGGPQAPGGGMGEMMGKMMAPPNSGGAAPPPAAAGPSAAGGGMAGMKAPAAGGCMGGNCGSGAAQTPIYPSLMTLPALTPEKRIEIEALASQQINEGTARLAAGSESLNRATQAGDNAAMQQSVGVMHQGLDELGAGIAARRVLSEGKAPRNLALDWFKREMNLASPISRDAPHALLGVTPFHLFTMGLLISFALAMVAMYFFKMRRATALFGRLNSDSGSPPPGSSPPLAGGPGPASPVAPSAGKGQPPSAAPTSSSPTTARAEKSPAPRSPAGAEPPAAPTAPATPAPAATPTSDPSPAGASATGVSEVNSAPPMTAKWRGQLRVGSVLTETPSVKTIRLLPSSSDSLMPFTFVPGQFLNVAFSIGGARMNRSYSISSSPTQRDHVDLTVRREPRGAVSRHIDDLLKLGDQIEAGGPVGRVTFSGTEADSVVLIAGGVGITPMMSITRYLTERSWAGDIFFVYACRAPSDFIFAKEIAALERVNPKLHMTVTMSGAEGTDWKGPRGRLTKELLTQAIPDLASRRVHLCGPPSMMEATKAVLAELGVAPEQVKTEVFGATKPKPAAAGTSSKPTAPATGPLVTFSKNNKSAKIHVDQSILELSEELAIGIEFSCRVGTCGVCKVKMTSGEVEMAVEDALEPDDKVNGIILACQAKPKGDVAVEA